MRNSAGSVMILRENYEQIHPPACLAGCLPAPLTFYLSSRCLSVHPAISHQSKAFELEATLRDHKQRHSLAERTLKKMNKKCRKLHDLRIRFAFFFTDVVVKLRSRCHRTAIRLSYNFWWTDLKRTVMNYYADDNHKLIMVKWQSPRWGGPLAG